MNVVRTFRSAMAGEPNGSHYIKSALRADVTDAQRARRVGIRPLVDADSKPVHQFAAKPAGSKRERCSSKRQHTRDRVGRGRCFRAQEVCRASTRTSTFKGHLCKVEARRRTRIPAAAPGIAALSCRNKRYGLYRESVRS